MFYSNTFTAIIYIQSSIFNTFLFFAAIDLTLADEDEEQADLEIQAVIFKADEKDNNSVLLIVHCVY